MISLSNIKNNRVEFQKINREINYSAFLSGWSKLRKIHRGGAKSKTFSARNNLIAQNLSAKLFTVDPAGTLRQGVLLLLYAIIYNNGCHQSSPPVVFSLFRIFAVSFINKCYWMIDKKIIMFHAVKTFKRMFLHAAFNKGIVFIIVLIVVSSIPKPLSCFPPTNWFPQHL